MTRLGTKKVDHRSVVTQLRAQPGVWLPVGEYRTQGSADVIGKAISTGRWNRGYTSPYTAGEFEPRTELTEFGVRVLARYLGTQQQRDVDAFNARYPVGTPVFAYPGCRPKGDPKDPRLVTRTRSEATVLGGHTAVVWVDGHSACIALTHVDVVSERQHDVAHAAFQKDAEEQVLASCEDLHHPTWLHAKGDTRGCPWCRIEKETNRER